MVSDEVQGRRGTPLNSMSSTPPSTSLKKISQRSKSFSSPLESASADILDGLVPRSASFRLKSPSSAKASRFIPTLEPLLESCEDDLKSPSMEPMSVTGRFDAAAGCLTTLEDLDSYSKFAPSSPLIRKIAIIQKSTIMERPGPPTLPTETPKLKTQPAQTPKLTNKTNSSLSRSINTPPLTAMRTRSTPKTHGRVKAMLQSPTSSPDPKRTTLHKQGILSKTIIPTRGPNSSAGSSELKLKRPAKVHEDEQSTTIPKPAPDLRISKFHPSPPSDCTHPLRSLVTPKAPTTASTSDSTGTVAP